MFSGGFIIILKKGTYLFGSSRGSKGALRTHALLSIQIGSFLCNFRHNLASSDVGARFAIEKEGLFGTFPSKSIWKLTLVFRAQFSTTTNDAEFFFLTQKKPKI